MSDVQGSCPFGWGDRVDHRIFGLGTVDGEPKAMCGAREDLRGTEFKGWSVPVAWDDPERRDGKVGHNHLKLVERPDSKGGAYWNNEYGKLIAEAYTLRKKTDAAIQSAFRAPGGTGLISLRLRLKSELAVLTQVTEFLEADERGEHP